jgi:hypothetical protein
MQCRQKPDSKFTTKNGDQHTMNTPITMPSVFAAFISVANFASFLLKEKIFDIALLLAYVDIILADECLDNPLFW